MTWDVPSHDGEDGQVLVKSGVEVIFHEKCFQ